MKIPALLTCLLAAVLSALPMSQARADDVSFDVFYNSLGDQGDWYNTPDYGYVWQPTVAAQNDKWRPYTDGYWAQTDDGWTWVSYENFGWATYHYGRWTNLEGTGWVWVPGYEWGPGWVSWRTSDEYVGWAPLPPKPENGGGGSPVTIDYNTVEPDQGYNASVDEQYDIGPSNYCFVETRYFGAPVLSAVLVPPQRNVVIIENTINVTDIRYNRGGPRVVVFNGGPDFGFISGRVEHPIQRLRIEQNNHFDFGHGPLGHNPNVVRAGVFQVAAPSIARRPVNFAELRPPTVKRDIRDPHVEHGWSNTGADQATVQRLHQQFQQQARENPTRPPGNNPAAAGFTPPGRPPGNQAGGFTTPARDARTTVPPANPAAVNTPRGNTDADRNARRDAAQHDTTRPNGGASNPGTPGGQPFTTPRDPRHGPNTQDVTHEPTATPARETNPNRESHNHGPANTPPGAPATTPRSDVTHEDHRTTHQESATTPANNTPEEIRHTPHQSDHPQTTGPTRNTEPEERSTRSQEHTQTPPPAPHQEVHEIRETRPATQTPPSAPRQEVHETHQETHDTKGQPSGNDDDKKKKHDGQ